MSNAQSSSAPQGWEITPRATADLLRDQPNRVLLIDCRTDEERATACIVGSVHIPMGDTAARLSEIDGAPADHVIVHCHHGVRSLRVVEFLRRSGIEHAVSMAGGIERWSIEVDPAVPRY